MGYVHNRIPEPDRTRLRAQAVLLYVGNRMPLRAVAERIGYGRDLVETLLDEAGVQLRDRHGRDRPAGIHATRG